MLDIKSVNPFELPSIPIALKRELPICPSIYFVLEGEEVVYIGRSVNPRNRWSCHHKIKEVSTSSRIAWIEISDFSLLPQIETSLINSFKPRLNESCPIESCIEPKGSLKNRVGSFIERKGLSVYQFIKETGISTTTGYRLANEESHLPSITVLSMLCEAYRVQPTEFVYWDGD